ncbi:MAG: OmpA family protein [Kiloniellales bacterium]
MRTRRILLGACLALGLPLALPLTAQAGPLDGFMVGIFDTNSGFGLEPRGIVFSNTLHDGYLRLSQSRSGAFDLHDGELFNHKARAAARRSVVIPDEISDRDLDDGDRAELSEARIRLRKVFLKGGKEAAPVDTGYAQVAFDCWIEAAEAGREEDAERCRQEFLDCIGRAEALAGYGPWQIAATPGPMPGPEPYLVYFQWDSTVMTRAGRNVLDQAIRDALADPNMQIRLVGHADRSGPEAYNQRLSQRRTETVTQEMVSAGINASRITGSAAGERQPFVPTDDGVRHPGNRVVEIDMM